MRSTRELQLQGEPVAGVPKLVVEVAVEPVAHQPADDHGEDDQDDQRQSGGDRRKPPTDGPALRRQGREDVLKLVHPEPP